MPYPADQFRYFVFAERFGWTPEQVDQQPAQLLDWLLEISRVVDEVKNEAVSNGK